MSRRVNLLLLLSALLSALTGVGAGVRQPPVAQTVAGSVRTVAAAVAARATTARPVAPRVSLAMLAAMPAVRWFAPAPIRPLFAGRRRE
jgi:hypothetical protein